MGQLIEVDFKARRQQDPTALRDPVPIAKRIRKAIKKAKLTPKIKVSVKTIRAHTVPGPQGMDRILVTVKEAECRAYRRAWLDWVTNPETKHQPRPPEAELPSLTDQMAAVMRTLRSIIHLHPGNYCGDVMVDPALGIAELHEYERVRRSVGVTS